MKTQQGNKSPRGKTSFHVHVGLGHLGIGAVVPFLHLQFQKRQLLMVQRSTGWWSTLEDDSFCYLKNTSGFFKAHKIWKLAQPGDLDKRIKSLKTLQREAIVIVVPHVGYVTSLLKSMNCRDTTISCSVSDGQAELAASLKVVADKWSEVFLFENTYGECWGQYGLEKRVHQVVVDRICWHLNPDDKQKTHQPVTTSGGGSGMTFPERECVCEKKYASFQWPADIGRFSAHQGKRKQFGFYKENRFGPVSNIKLAVKRKRALVNATHSILGILCCRLLAEKEMRPEKQYLAPLQALLAKAHPEWHAAIDTYIQLRSIEMCLMEIDEMTSSKNGGSCGLERCHMIFSNNYEEAICAHDRFLNTADVLERLISSEKLLKELGKYDEHIVGPFKVYEQNRTRIEQLFVFERPDMVEIKYLKDFLNESFLSAMKWLSKHDRKHPQ